MPYTALSWAGGNLLHVLFIVALTINAGLLARLTGVLRGTITLVWLCSSHSQLKIQGAQPNEIFMPFSSEPTGLPACLGGRSLDMWARQGR